MINKATLIDFIKFGIPCTLFVVSLEYFENDNSTPLYLNLSVGLIISFIYGYYRNVLKPIIRSKATKKELKGLEKFGYDIITGEYVGEYEGLKCSISFLRHAEIRLPTLIISVYLNRSLVIDKNSLKLIYSEDYNSQSSVICITHEISDMRTIIEEAKNEIEKIYLSLMVNQ